MNSLLDDVNALLKLKHGDLGRLEHIKETLESRNVLYISDTKYLRELTREYLEDNKGKKLERFNSYDYPEYTNQIKNTPTSKSEDTYEDDKEAKQMAKNLEEVWTQESTQMAKNLKGAGKISGDISEYVKKSKPEIIDTGKNYFCGNCGNTIKNENFCRKCGSSLHIEEEKQDESKFRKSIPQEKISTKNEVKISKSTLVIIILFGVIIVGGVAMGIKIIGENEIQTENIIKTMPVIETTPVIVTSSTSDLNSKCGAGTVFDEVSNSCILEGSKIASESNSKCGAGTVFDEVSNSCILG